MMCTAFLYLALLVTYCLAALSGPSAQAASRPQVTLGNATVIGTSDGTTNSFLGIPFAQPPVGPLRLNLPQPVTSYQGVIDASTWGNSCLNTTPSALTVDFPTWLTLQMVEYLGSFNLVQPTPFGEDCLNINVITPADAKPGDKLPVVAYIFFSGFDFSGASNVDGRVMVNRSMQIGEPVIWVSMNYRLGPYGFLPGREVGAAGVGNLGLQDQREGLRWIKKYIENFGGNPDRVVLLGISSGGVSSTFQTVANGGDNENLFHGVWAESGSLQHLPRIDDEVAQLVFDNFVNAVNCSDAASGQVLQCVRELSSAEMQSAVGSSAAAFWDVTVDGTFLVDMPQISLVKGNVSNVPVVTGIAEDDGTIATLDYSNGVDNTTVENYVRRTFPNITDDHLAHMLQLYPDVPSQGAPYDTGDEYQLFPQYKRIGSLACDILFDSNHRLYAQNLAIHNRDVWSYYYERNFVYGFGVLRRYRDHPCRSNDLLPFDVMSAEIFRTHGSELPNMYGGGDMADMFIHFANTLDPNGANPKKHWPKYTVDQPVMLAFTGNDTFDYINDTYRADGIDFINYLNVNT